MSAYNCAAARRKLRKAARLALELERACAEAHAIIHAANLPEWTQAQDLRAAAELLHAMTLTLASKIEGNV